MASYLPIFVDPFLAPYQLLNLSYLGVVPGLAIGLVVYELGIYLYHITMHKYDFLWRTFHQVHHSAERLDAYGALFHSPLDMIGFTLVGSITLTLGIGLSPEVITILLFIINFMAFFQHANIKTPQWIGYLIQRPESHSIHHAKGIHAYNYSDLPIFDIVFGTFRNPKLYDVEIGFYHGASARVLEMLRWKDISRDKR